MQTRLRMTAPVSPENAAVSVDGTGNSDGGLPWMLFFFIFGVFFFVQPYTLFWSAENIPTPDAAERLLRAGKGIAGRPIGLILLALLSVFILIRGKLRCRFHRGPLSFAVVFFICWAWLSIVWSDETALTFTRLAVFSLLWVSAAAFGQRLSRRQIVMLVVFVESVTLILSLGSDIATGYFQPFADDYRFSGVMHPNDQAYNCGLLLLASVCRLKMTDTGRRWPYVCIALTALVFLVLTRSRTTMIASLFAGAFLLGITAPGRRIGVLISVAAFVFPFLVAIAIWGVDPETVAFVKDALLLGRETEVGTLTGRVPMWVLLLKYVFAHPFLGYGYDSFWTAARTSVIMASVGSWVASDHSTYFNMLLGLGAIGLAGFLCILALSFARSIRLFVEEREAAVAFIGAMLVMMSINMALETIWFQANFVTFLGMTAIANLVFAARRTTQAASRRLSPQPPAGVDRRTIIPQRPVWKKSLP